MSVVRDAARRAALRAVRGGADRLGFDLVARGWESPLPKLHLVPDEAWSAAKPLVGLELDVAEQLEFLGTALAGYLDEFRPPLDSSDPRTFHLRNGSFESVDAELLYAMIRHARPRTVLELGAGHSTLVAAAAVARNHEAGADCRFVSVDPDPPAFLDPPPEYVAELRRVPATAVPLEEFEALGAGDVLFVDTTHVVALGSEVNYLVLDVLPRLQPGVLVHFHDIFIPWEYPRRWLEELGYYWTEQYLVQAFLCFNAAYRLRIAAHHLARAAADRLSTLISSFEAGVTPGSCWIERVDG
jgi:hypothetical protein